MADSTTQRSQESAKQNHFYVAVGSPSMKLITLVELLEAFEEDVPFGVAICCRTRDSLDEVLSGLVREGFSSQNLSYLHSDMREQERIAVIRSFKQRLSDDASGHKQDSSLEDLAGLSPTTQWMICEGLLRREDYAPGASPPGYGGKARVLAVTDVCCRATQRELQGTGIRLLISYDLPLRKDVHQRRLSALFGPKGKRGGGRPPPGASRSVLHVVAAGEARVFREIEQYTGAPIVEVPVRVSDMLR
mmetsp:Transcript_43126/g.102370  ORF Transcript_43126/g.102370 Transcript_43126/m.102370 type:complete len:247 (-) Transcript_43126:1748-2488(-)